ncbi:MAG: preprotein translocase subunit SecG [Alphaproteobacteria bacterium]|nr:preprotein translocase subunit SecG [Pseudomonadota bacterium]TDI68300.1 MAG: preprotein translocase subunit SecG [Alphaproteobacteria bacterium]
MNTIILTIHLILALSLVICVLLQRSEGGALGIGGGGGGFMTSRAQSNLLTRATAMLAAAFMATSLTLAILASQDRKPQSVLDQGVTPRPSAPATPQAPTRPGVPLGR